LEHEAAVLRDPENAQAWFDLGVKQQANEREAKAIQALRRAVELDPSLLSAWLELAVSYTNEGNRSSAYDAIEDWIDRKESYVDAVLRWRESRAGSSSKADRVQGLIGCLIEMARSVPGGAIDADVQIALGVLLNTSEVSGNPSREKAASSVWRSRNTIKRGIVFKQH
jgi:peroxin-5